MQTAAVEPPSVAVVSPDPIVRRAVRAALEESGEVAVADAEDEYEALEGAVDALVWDAGLDGGELPPELATPAVMLLADAAAADRAWRRGVAGVVERGAEGEMLVAAVRAVAVGLRVFDPALGTGFGGAGFAGGAAGDDLIEPLTPRELEVLALVADGLSNRRIAKRLGISEHTVKFHINSILEKLDADTRTAAVVRAARHGLLHL